MRDGDWSCPSCHSHCYASRSHCFRCATPRPHLFAAQASGPQHGQQLQHLQQQIAAQQIAQQQIAAQQHLASAGAGAVGLGNMRPGDWICPGCSNHNYASRAVCHRCQLPKQASAAAAWVGSGVGSAHFGGPGGMGAAAVVSMSGGTPTLSTGGGNIDMRPGDWLCQVCSNHNYADKQACNRCATPKGLATAAHGVKQLRPGDWLCDGPGGCSNVNFASRLECNKCGRPKATTATTVTVQAAAGRLAGGANARPGDWSCAKCGNHNYASRTACNKCQAPKPASSSDAGADGACLGVGKAGGLRANDWICADSACGNVNYGFRTVCNKCSLPKPVGEEPVESAAAATVETDTGRPLGGVADLASAAVTAAVSPRAIEHDANRRKRSIPEAAAATDYTTSNKLVVGGSESEHKQEADNDDAGEHGPGVTDGDSNENRTDLGDAVPTTSTVAKKLKTNH